MVILIASEQAAAGQALAEHLAGNGENQVFTAAGMADLEEAASSLEELDVLLFSAAFNGGRGKELRDALRVQFPGLQTALIGGDDGETVPAEQISEWLAGLQESTIRPSDGEVGPVLLGDYELREKRRTTPTTDSFLAVQRSVNREVVLERLKPELHRDKPSVKEFRAMVRARANVSCPWIATVFEAQESEGALFYTRELVRGSNLDEIAASRAHITPEESLQLLRSAGEAMVWFTEKNLPRGSLRRHHIYLGADGAPRIANTAAPATVALDEAGEIRAIAEGILRVTDFKAGPARDLTHVLGLMKATGPHALTTWKSMLREARAALQRLTEARTSSLEASRDGSRPRRHKSHKPLIAGVVALAGIGTAVAWYAKNGKTPPAKEFAFQAFVPAGDFTFRDGSRINLPDFWLDSHEVTIGQYADFLAATAGPDRKKFDHPEQPKEKTSHEPKVWSAIHTAAKSGESWNGYPVSKNSPVFNVDWWDAFAFAAWKSRRLPTEQEWDKAARGTNGLPWPWGSEADPQRANTGADYAEHPGAGAADGYTWWCDVNAMPRDVSPYEVYGMAGNVSEWTATWSPDPDDPDKAVPVYRGGDFRNESPALVTTPWLAKGPSYAQPFLGFRTVSSTPPSTAK